MLDVSQPDINVFCLQASTVWTMEAVRSANTGTVRHGKRTTDEEWTGAASRGLKVML